MALSQRLDLRQSQSLVLTPQLQQAIKLLQLNNIELAEYVDGEIAQNQVFDESISVAVAQFEHSTMRSAVRVISDNKHYHEYERTADEIHIVGRIRWFAREI